MTDRAISDALGLTDLALAVANIHNHIETLEDHMATAREQLDNLTGKVDDLVADVRSALDILRAERENLTPDAQAAFDTLTAKVDAFDAEVGDADGSDVPPVEPEPTP